MLIRCKIKRPGGSRVTLGSERYHFAPDDLGRHVAEVTNEAHIERLLSIPAYEAVEDDVAADVAPTQDSGTLAPQGEDETPTREALSDEEMELELARSAYLEKFGKAAHPRAHASTLWQRIEAGEA